MRVRYPADLRIEVATSAQLPGAGEQWLTVQVGIARGDTAIPVAGRVGRLVVVRGEANQAEVLLTKARTNIGRPWKCSRKTFFASKRSGVCGGFGDQSHSLARA